jgi:hypothetical protein
LDVDILTVGNLDVDKRPNSAPMGEIKTRPLTCQRDAELNAEPGIPKDLEHQEEEQVAEVARKHEQLLETGEGVILETIQ